MYQIFRQEVPVVIKKHAIVLTEIIDIADCVL
jgi:hypothetical protein